MKPAFIAFSDIHIEDWKRYSIDHSRLNHNHKIIRRIVNLSIKYGKIPVLFCGDLFDNPKYLTNLVMNKAFLWLREFYAHGIEVFCIAGNHDQSEKNVLGHESPNYISLVSLVYPSFQNINYKQIHYGGKYTLHGIPYQTNNQGFDEAIGYAVDFMDSKSIGAKGKHILMIHRDIPGARDSNGRVVGVDSEFLKLNKYFKKFDLVLCGHIHKPQKLRSNVLMLGATHQQRISDAGTKMGCWKIYPDMTWKFVPLNMPEFTFDEENKEGNFFIEKPIEIKDLPESVKVFNTNDPVKLAKAYMKAKGLKSRSKRKLLIEYLNEE